MYLCLLFTRSEDSPPQQQGEGDKKTVNLREKKKKNGHTTQPQTGPDPKIIRILAMLGLKRKEAIPMA